MSLGRQFLRAMTRRGMTQVDVARRTGMQTKTVSDVVNDRVNPKFDTIERMVAAIGCTYGELFDEPRIQLSEEDVGLVANFAAFLERLRANDAAQKVLSKQPSPTHATRRRKPESTTTRIWDAPRTPKNHEVENLPNETIPQWHYRAGARRAFKVLTDAMIGVGILQGGVVYVLPTTYLDKGDGEIVVCTLNGTTYLKRLDLRGGQTALESENPRYPILLVGGDDELAMIGIVVMKPAD